MCFCDAMLQHSEAILCPVHKVTKDRGGDKSNLTITVLKKRGLWNQLVSHVESVWQVKNRTAC